MSLPVAALACELRKNLKTFGSSHDVLSLRFSLPIEGRQSTRKNTRDIFYITFEFILLTLKREREREREKQIELTHRQMRSSGVVVFLIYKVYL